MWSYAGETELVGSVEKLVYGDYVEVLGVNGYVWIRGYFVHFDRRTLELVVARHRDGLIRITEWTRVHRLYEQRKICCHCFLMVEEHVGTQCLYSPTRFTPI